MTSENFFLTFSIRLAVATSLLFQMHAEPAFAQACIRDSSATPFDPYTGYPPDGFRGEPVRDQAWFSHVVPVRDGDQTHYRFRRLGPTADRINDRYESIETISLGKGTGYVARREGCSELLDGRGQSLGLEPFDEIGEDYSLGSDDSPTSILLRVKSTETWRLARFSGTKLVAQTPRSYLSSYSGSTLDQQLPPGLRDVAAGPNSLHGVIRLDTLEEIVPPQWRGVGGLWFYGKAPDRFFVIVDNGETRKVLNRNGQPTAIDGVNSVEVVDPWFPFELKGPPLQKVAVITNLIDGRFCRLYDSQLNLLMPFDIRLQYGRCPRPVRSADTPPYFGFVDREGKTRIYSFADTPMLKPEAVIDAPMVQLFQTGVVVVSIGVEPNLEYRVFDHTGQRIGNEDFSAFHNLGCDFVEVQRQGKWITLLKDGTLTEERFYPISC